MTEQTPKIRLIALDMDGTLLNSGKKVPEENRRALREAVSRGVTPVYATGRAVCELEEYFRCFRKSDMRFLPAGQACMIHGKERRSVCIPCPWIRSGRF